MSFDLGGPALEIAIALSFVFLLLSLVASAVMEGIAALLKFRSKNLKKGLEGMLGDSEMVQRLFCHPLVRTDLNLDRDKDPSYISPRNFALAFLDTVDVSQATEGLSRQMSALTRSSSTDLPDVPELEKWFDESMDRVSGWYKRKSQIWTYGIAVVLAVGLNVSALRIAEQLSAEPTVRAAVVAKAEAAAAQSPDGGAKNLEQAGKDVESAVDDLAGLDLPVFWVDEAVPRGEEEILATVAGWLITIFAISLGAPFWFDALGKLANLRMAGKKPEEKPAS